MTLSQSNEHLRVSLHGAKTSSRSLNIDPTRDLLNFEITQGCQVVSVDKRTSIPKRIRENLKKRGIEDPNKKYKKLGLEPKIRTVANFILGGSRDQMHRLAFGNQKVNLERGADNSSIRRMPEIENWAKDMYRFMSDRFGEKNIAAFVVHLDETNPHIHCTVLPITEQNKFSWKQVMVGENNSKFEYQKRTTELHNAIAEINAKYGLERGDKISETGAKHRSTAEYHEALRKELKEQNKRLFDTKIVLDDAIEKNEETIKEQKQTIDSLNKEIKHASARVKGLSTMIEHLETYKEDLEKEIAKLKADRDSGKIDPKADLTFKKIFGNHPKRLISLLNALLPLSEEEQIHEIKYLPTELVPQLEGGKNTIVDVLCTDVRGRKFCVEMQMEWSDAFQQRVLFNASKLYVSQAKKGGKYSELQPVYSLNLINDIFAHDTPDFIHNYRIVHDKDSNKVIEGLHFTFIELPKFTPHSIADKRMMVLWLRFLTEINSNTKDIPADLLNDRS